MTLKNIAAKLCGWAIISLIATGCGRVEPAEAKKPTESPKPVSRSIVIQKTVVAYDDTSVMSFVNDDAIFLEGWDTLAQPKFWKQILSLPPDSCIINIARSRTPLEVACFSTWCLQDESSKTGVKSRLRETYCVDDHEELYVTSGKREFYEHRKSIPTISRAVNYFQENGVDPWYAQTILLIESPGKYAQKSSVGANGPFQLMKSVATMYGLKVNKYVDERSDLKRAAYAASRLIGGVCIPKIKALLDSKNIKYNETDLWFRLLVLHAYHAGPGNVACVINKLNPTEGGQQLIRTMWQTECGGFKNESQNYSQIALAAIMNFEDILRKDGDSVFLVQGDRHYAFYQGLEIKPEGEEAESALSVCIRNYERDFVDGLIPFDYFIERVKSIRNDLAVAQGIPQKQELMTSVLYPADEHHYIHLGKELIRKRKVDDAVRLLRFNVESFPNSQATVDSLQRAYKLNGYTGLSQKNMTKSSVTR